jgi:hypothetical protein
MVNKVLEKCIQERYLGAVLFAELLAMHETQDLSSTVPIGKVILLDPASTRKAETQPDKSDLGAYEKAFNR